MKLLKRMKKSNNRKNSGFTLVELVIVMAIMGILGLAVAGFIGTSTKQYKYASKDVDLQYEAQLTMNQIGDLIIDAQKGVKYEPATVAAPVEVASAEPKDGYVATASAEETSSEETSAEETSSEEASAEETSSDSKLIIYNNDCTYYIIYRQSEHKIYLRKDTLDPATGAVKADGQVKESLMAENVTGFTPDLSEAEKKNSVGLVMDFKAGDKKYTSKQNFTMRNKVPVGKDVEYVAPAEPEKGLRVRIYHDGDDVTDGSVAHEMTDGTNVLYFTSKVLGDDSPSQEVNWTVTGNTSWANINPQGVGSAKLEFDGNETSKQLKVTVTSKQDSTKSASTTIYIKSSVKMLEKSNEFINSGSTIHVWIANNPTDYALSDFTWHIKVEQVMDDGSKIGRNDLLLRYSTTEIVGDKYSIDKVNYWYVDPKGNPSTHISLGNNLMPNNGYKLQISIWLEIDADPEFKSNTVVLKNYHF